MFQPDGPTFWELLDQSLCNLEDGYDKLAPKFDATPFRTPDVILEAVSNHLGGEQSVDSTLDMCCGTGAAMYWNRRLARHRNVGLDGSQGMLDQAAKHCANAPGIAPNECVKGDALAPPFHEEFDLVTCFGAFGHFLPREEKELVAGVKQCLKPGGRFAYVTHPEISKFDVKALPYRLFNAAMLVRNAVIDPPFVMYYLGFTTETSTALLEAEGFSVDVQTGILPAPFSRLHMVVATKGDAQ